MKKFFWYDGDSFTSCTIMPTQTVPLLPLVPGLGALNTNLRDAQRNAVAKALAVNAEPVFQEDAGLERGTLNIPPGLHERVRLMAEERKISFQSLWVGLVRAGFATMLSDVTKMTYHIDTAPPQPFAMRGGDAGRLQTTYWQSVIGSLQRDRVVVAEGSTGLGKGRVLVAAALERARSGVKPVAIAAPTLKTLAQLWGEYEDLVQENPSRWAGLRVRFLPGITEFVDPLKVQNYLAEAAASNEGVDEAVKLWYERGGVSADNPPLARALQMAHGSKDANGNLVEMNFLADDLRNLATEVEPSVLLLDPDDGKEDPRVIAAKRQAVGAHVVFCTHAMIAWQHKSQWAAWPERPKCLIIDEAHEFERAVAQSNTKAIALRALRRSVVLASATGLIKKTAATQARKALQDLEFCCNSLVGDDDSFPQVSLDNVGDDFRASFSRLRELLSKKPYEKLPRIAHLRQDLAEIHLAIKNTQMLGWIDFSPRRAFPSIVAGRHQLGPILGSLWKEADRGVALASATLTVPNLQGDPKADYLVSVLALPKHRTDMPPSVTLPAVLNLPVLHLPSKSHYKALARPFSKTRTEDTEKIWMDNLSRVVTAVVSRPSIKGGSLVLLTSHTQVKTMATHLREVIDENRIIAALPGVRFSQTQDQFVAASRAGLKPVLLGLGTAWTGLDLSDKTVPAEADFLLTDLVIGCMPIGLNRTATMRSRIEYTGANAIAKEALMMLRQGLGRLIRREGVTDRHIWFLDGRLWMDWTGMEAFTAPGRKMLQQYKHRTGITFN